MRQFVTSMVVAMMLTTAALAAEQVPDGLGMIVEQQHALAMDIDAGKVGGMTTRQVNVVRKAQKQVFALIDGKSSMSQLSIDDKVKLENALERINSEIKGGGRMATEDTNVCWRERKTGSTVKVTRCGTKAERDQVRQGARDWMEKPKICNPPGCG